MEQLIECWPTCITTMPQNNWMGKSMWILCVLNWVYLWICPKKHSRRSISLSKAAFAYSTFSDKSCALIIFLFLWAFCWNRPTGIINSFLVDGSRRLTTILTPSELSTTLETMECFLFLPCFRSYIFPKSVLLIFPQSS